jgi:hypothetical protein
MFPHAQVQKLLFCVADLEDRATFATGVNVFDQHPQTQDVVDIHVDLVVAIRHDHLSGTIRKGGHYQLPKGWELATHGALVIEGDPVHVDEELVQDSSPARQFPVIPGSQSRGL